MILAVDKLLIELLFVRQKFTRGVASAAGLDRYIDMINSLFFHCGA